VRFYSSCQKYKVIGRYYDLRLYFNDYVQRKIKKVYFSCYMLFVMQITFSPKTNQVKSMFKMAAAYLV